MKRKHMTVFLSAVSVAVLCLIISACGKNNNNSNPEVSSEITSGIISGENEVTTEAITEGPKSRTGTVIYNVIHRDNISPALDWNRQSQTLKNAAGKSVTAWWNINACITMGCNFINPFPNYRGGGTSVAGAQLPGDNYKSIIEYCQPGLEVSHEKGIQVVSSLPMCLMNVARYEAAGDDWKQYCSVKSNGSYSMNAAQDTAYACINNPKFQEKIRSCTVQAAKAGYDGMFYDANPYAYGVKYNCCCEYCKKGWAEYSKEHLGKETPMPSADPVLSNETGRLFWKWRLDIYIDFVLSMRDECRQYQKNFTVWPNTGMNGTHACYYALKGLESAMCEFGANTLLNPGVESTLYLYRQYEAENPNDFLIMQFNSIDSQATPGYKFDTAFVEACAGGGALMAPTASTRINQFGKLITASDKIKTENADAFCDSISIAETAVVYSWQEINAYHLKVAGTPSLSQNTARKTAAVLAAKGIPYDYVMPENTKDISALTRYKTLIFTDFSLLDKDFEKLVSEFIGQGGQVIILGNSFAKHYQIDYGVKIGDWEEDVLKRWTGKTHAEADADRKGERISVGDGNVFVLKSYMTGNSFSAAFDSVIENAGLYNIVRVTEDVAGNVETVIRSDATSNRWWLHCITYASEGVYDDKKITVEVTVPEGDKVTSVTAVSPTLNSDKIGLSWKQEGTKLTVTAEVGLWTMFTINKVAE